AVRLWDAGTGALVRALDEAAKKEDVRVIAFSPDGRTLAASSDKLKLWDVATGRLVRDFEEDVYAVAFSPDGKLVAGVTLGRAVKLWEAGTGRLARALEANAYLSPEAISFSPDGATLAVVTYDGSVDLWDMARASVRRTLKSPDYREGMDIVRFSPDGGRLFVSNAPHIGRIQRSLDLWDVAANEIVTKIDGRNIIIDSVAFSPDGKTFIAVGSGERSGQHLIRLWDAASGEVVRRFGTWQGGVTSLAVNAERKSVVMAAEKAPTKFYDLGAGPICALERTRELRSVAFGPEGRTVVLGDPSNSSLSFWDAGDCRRIGEFAERRFAFSHDGKAIAEWHRSKAVNLYDAARLRVTLSLRGHAGDIEDFAFSPDGRHGASASIDGTARLWELGTGQSLRAFEGHAGGATAVAFSADNRVLATAGRDGAVKLWDAATGRPLHTLAGHTRAVAALAFDSTGKLFASCDVEGGVRLWDAKSGAALRTLGSFPRGARTVFFGPDGKTVAALGLEPNEYGNAPADLTVFKLWDAATGRLILDLKGLEVKSASFSRGGRAVLVAAGLPYKGTTTKVYSAATGEVLADVIGFGDGSWVVVTPEGFFDGPPAAWNQIAWRFAGNRIAPVEIFFNEFYRPGLLAEVLDGAPPKAPRAFAQLDRRQPRLRLSRADAAKPGDEIKTRTLKVKIDIDEAPAGGRDVRLFRNGSLVRVWRGDVLKGRAAALETEITVEAGENVLTAYAFNNDDIKSADATLELKGASALARKGVARLVAVGVNAYANPRYDLKYAVADAVAFGEEFKRQQERLGRYERVEVKTLTDRQATKAGILRALEELSAVAEPEDAVVVFFAGHGTARDSRFYLLPHDLGYAGAPSALDRAGLEAMLAHGVSDRELERAFEKIDAARLLFVIDACNSGQALEAAERRRGPMNSKGLAQLAYEKGMYILTASQSYEAAQEASQLGHGLLTYALVEEGLKRAAADTEPKDGTVHVKEWLDFAARRVPEIQLEEMSRAATSGRDLSFAEEERGITLARRQGQRPRLYYRRELEARPLVVAKTRN
ncbi:MAG TPA: caspase family protein, partial [Pyrinomonadaceae bacterium]